MLTYWFPIRLLMAKDAAMNAIWVLPARHVYVGRRRCQGSRNDGSVAFRCWIRW